MLCSLFIAIWLVYKGAPSMGFGANVPGHTLGLSFPLWVNGDDNNVPHKPVHYMSVTFKSA